MSELIPIKGDEDKKLPLSENFTETIIQNSIIQEEKIFNEGEILGLIERLAQLEKINKKYLALQERILDEKGNLIGLSVIVQPERAYASGWRSINYEYSIKGTHGHEKAGQTFIARIYNLCEPQTSQGGIIAKYQNGQWVLSPNQIDPQVNLESE